MVLTLEGTNSTSTASATLTHISPEINNQSIIQLICGQDNAHRCLLRHLRNEITVPLAISIYWLQSISYLGQLVSGTDAEWCHICHIDVALMSYFTHFEKHFTGFLALFMRSWFSSIFPKRGCTLYTKLLSLHHAKGLNKGCVLYTGASYTHKITILLNISMHSINYSFKTVLFSFLFILTTSKWWELITYLVYFLVWG